MDTTRSTPPSTLRSTHRGRGRPRRDDVDEQILVAARALIDEHGVNGFSVAAVARQVGVGKPLIYRRWPSRALLVYDALFRAGDAGVPVFETGDIRRDVALGLQGLVSTFSREPGMSAARAILVEALRDAAFRDRFRAEQLRRDREAVAATIRRAADRNEIALETDAELVAELLIGWALDRCLVRDEPPTASEIAGAVALVLR